MGLLSLEVLIGCETELCAHLRQALARGIRLGLLLAGCGMCGVGLGFLLVSGRGEGRVGHDERCEGGDEEQAHHR